MQGINEIWSDPTIEDYLAEIRDFNPLSVVDELELSRRAQEGDEQALNELVKANLKFVITIAKQYQNFGLPLLDLISEGNLGLVIAAKRFDGSRGFKFITYAVWWIRQSILKAIAEQSRVVRLPLNRIAELIRITRISRSLEQRLGRKPNLNEVIDEVEIKGKNVNLLFCLAKPARRLDDPVDVDEPDRCLINLILYESSQSSEDDLFEKERGENIKQAILNLCDEREAKILFMYYGLDGYNPMTLAQIGLLFGLTRERVRQLRDRALMKLHSPESSRILRECL